MLDAIKTKNKRPKILNKIPYFELIILFCCFLLGLFKFYLLLSPLFPVGGDGGGEGGSDY